MLCGPALNAEESERSLEALRDVTLAGAAKFLITTGKFETDGAARSVNVEADYPAEPAYLRTLLSWAQIGDLSDPRFRDGYDLYCVRRVLARHGPFDVAVVLRGGAASFESRWPELLKSVEGRLFVTFDGDAAAALTPGVGSNILFDLRDDRAPAFLEAAMQLFLTGSVYGMSDYTLDRALGVALEAVEVQQRISQSEPVECASSEPLLVSS
jgi:hypothetical protein